MRGNELYSVNYGKLGNIKENIYVQSIDIWGGGMEGQTHEKRCNLHVTGKSNL